MSILFEAQSVENAKISKGMLNSSTGHAMVEKSRQVDRGLERWHYAIQHDCAKLKAWHGYTVPPLTLIGIFYNSCMRYKGGFLIF